MLKEYSKKFFNKSMRVIMCAMPAILTALLVFHANSTACLINGQPEPPKALKNYRKF
jgi:cyclic lactone autoinducer peptide